MKKLRILSLLLVIVMLLGVLCACGDDPADTTKKPAGSTPAGSGDSNWTDVNFSGTTLKIELSDYTLDSITEVNADNSLPFYLGPDDGEISSDGLMNAVIYRNDAVYEQLGIETDYIYDSTNVVANMLSHYQTLVDSGSAPDIVVGQIYGLIRAEINGLLVNLNETENGSKEGYNYFNLAHDGWFYDLMKETTLDESKIYLMAGDYFLDSIRVSYNMFVNTEKFEDIYKDRGEEGGMAYLYDLINQNLWDYDIFQELVEAAYEDSGDVTGEPDEADFFGVLSSSFAARSLFFTSNLALFENSQQNGLQYVSNNTALHNYVDKVVTMMNTEGSDRVTTGQKDALKRFLNGKSLFMTDQFLCTLEGPKFQSMDDAAVVIPYPKYDRTTPYRALVSDNANVGAILNTTEQFTACSAYLQMLTEESSKEDGVMYYYFEAGLKYKNQAAPSPDQIAILDTIRDGLICPSAFVFDNYVCRNLSADFDTIYDYIDDSIVGGIGTNTLASSWASQIDAKNGALADLFDKFEALD